MRVTALTDSNLSPAFPEGSAVRDRITGRTGTVTREAGDWTVVELDLPLNLLPGEDGLMLPTADLEAVAL